MKILFLTYGPPVVASSRTRVFQYLPFFKREGIKCKVIMNSTGLSYHLIKYFRSNSFVIKGIKFSLVKVIPKCDVIFSGFQIVRFTLLAMFYDVIFIQKVLIPTFAFKWITRIFNKPVVFDFDDAIYARPKSYNKARFDRQLPLYDLLVIENALVEEYVRRFTDNDILMVTGPIHCERYYPKKWIERDKVIVGWIGSPSEQKHLDILEHVFKRLSIVYKNLILELVGAQKINFDVLHLRQEIWNLNTEVADLQNFDIGIMPLSDNEWTRGKGGYKLLQYMAVGIPCVASPIGINKELIKDGENGFLATTEDEWYEKISLLIENPELRRKMGMRGRDFVVKNHSFDVATPKLISALERLRLLKE